MDRGDTVTAVITPVKLVSELRARSGPTCLAAEVVTRDLARYYRLLAEELEQVALTEHEALLVGHAMRQARESGRRYESLADTVEGELDQGLRERWEGVDGPSLCARLRGFSMSRTLALADALDRLEGVLRREKDPNREMGELLRAVGLVPANSPDDRMGTTESRSDT